MSDKPFGMTCDFGKNNPSPFYIFYPDAKKATMYSNGGLSTFGLSEVTSTKIRYELFSRSTTKPVKEVSNEGEIIWEKSVTTGDRGYSTVIDRESGEVSYGRFALEKPVVIEDDGTVPEGLPSQLNDSIFRRLPCSLKLSKCRFKFLELVIRK